MSLACQYALADRQGQCIAAYVPEKYYLQLEKKPELFDVIEVTKFQRQEAKGQSFIILKHPINIEISGLTAPILAKRDATATTPQ